MPGPAGPAPANGLAPVSDLPLGNDFAPPGNFTPGGGFAPPGGPVPDNGPAAAGPMNGMATITGVPVLGAPVAPPPAGLAPVHSPAFGGGQPPAAVSLADAVQSAHEEGQEFGSTVARDAPALWLEAVLARKPRMPSDLEARLLQGSSLPIDFLLHDEVRHALRRGFWDALERARR